MDANFRKFEKEAACPDGVVGFVDVQEDGNSGFFFFKAFFDIMVNFDQVICGAAVFPEASLLWAYDVL